MTFANAGTGKPGLRQWLMLMLSRLLPCNLSFLGQVPADGESRAERHIPLRLHRDHGLIDPQRGLPYVPNTIRTARYTIWNFLPKQLLFQFTRVGNFYFLCVGVPQTVPGLSTTGNYTTILPLLFFVMLTVLKEGWFDWKRHRQDKLENATPTTVLRISKHRKKRAWQESTPPFEWVGVQWKDVKVGDIVKLKRDDAVPADLILMHASGEDGLAYVETMALDGETNLKTKHAPSLLKDCGSIVGLAKCRAEFVVQAPTRDLYHFEGKLVVDGAAVPLTINELLHRGTTLRNTSEVIGIAVNTGEQSKIRMNANHHPRAKKPAVEKMVNYIIISLALYVVILSCGLSAGYRIWHAHIEEHAWYLNDASPGFHQIILGYFIQFNNVIPLALFVSLEVVKLVQQYLLNSDLQIYDEESDTPTRCNTNTILENLGQVNYVLTDKTGTLTENLLTFRKLSVVGTSWYVPAQGDLAEPANGACPSGTAAPQSPGDPVLQPLNPKPTRGSRSPHLRRSNSTKSHASSIAPAAGEYPTDLLIQVMQQRPNSLFARKTRDLLLAMALCHTCLPEEQDGQVEYQASSVDELALVRAASELGFTVVKRSHQLLEIKVNDTKGIPRTLTYEILDIIEFTSQRKRFSIIVRNPDGRIALICKGADSVIVPRLRQADLAREMLRKAEQNAQAEAEECQRLEQALPRNSFGGSPSLTMLARSGLTQNGSFVEKVARSQSLDLNHTRRQINTAPQAAFTRSHSFDRRKRALLAINQASSPRLPCLDDASFFKSETVFRKCFQQMENYAREGLRTLVYAQRFIPEGEYRAWKLKYDEANTSFANRQANIEKTAELIETNLELLGGTAIEDRLQQGVPATIDKLRRANIKVWMLTGDKRETAINIAQSAAICKPSSSIIVVDVASNADLSSQLAQAAREIGRKPAHSVMVFDGPTLAALDLDEATRKQLFALLLEVDSVICCRASPAQKAQLVHSIRAQRPGHLTLSIGDGGNDVAMIQEADVGVGISGGGAREGLQAARTADFSIPQFRFLQRLLLVHGRWSYARTSKFILLTFWKEAFFYLPAAFFQPYTGYTGTSLYESASLTVFNSLFTSLCVIILGIWDQDLAADTLLAVPELYVYGQRNLGLNAWKYLRWMIAAVCEGILVWFAVLWGYGGFFGPVIDDAGLFAFGNLAFSVGVIWINTKLFLFETHCKSYLVLFGFLITVAGWWVWNVLLSFVYKHQVVLYSVKFGFNKTFGADLAWWLTLVASLALLCCLQLAYMAIKRSLVVEGLWKWPPWPGGWKRTTLWIHHLFGRLLLKLPLAHDYPEVAECNGHKGNNHHTFTHTPGRGKCVEEWDLELWQELEQTPEIRDRLKESLLDEQRGLMKNALDDGEVDVVDGVDLRLAIMR